MISDSGANVVFVGHGCPMQEFWMAEHWGKVNAVMIRVGAAFDYDAGIVRRALHRCSSVWLGKYQFRGRLSLGSRTIIRSKSISSTACQSY